MLVQLFPLYNPVNHFLGFPPLLILDTPASGQHHRELEGIEVTRHHIFLGLTRSLRLSTENYRHPIMNVFHNLIRLCRDDRTGVNLLTVRSRPGVKQSR